jgi:hypothetical protein
MAEAMKNSGEALVDLRSKIGQAADPQALKVLGPAYRLEIRGRDSSMTRATVK